MSIIVSAKTGFPEHYYPQDSLLAAAQEIDKLALLVPEGAVDAEAVEHAVADSARFDVFQLVEATVTGQTEPRWYA